MDHVSGFEILAKDLERAERFYSTLFQWAFMERKGGLKAVTAPSDNRHIPVIRGAINGVVREEKQNGTKIIIKVDSIIETLQKAEIIGGKIITPIIDHSDDGLFAEILDTEGNLIELWQDTSFKS